MQSKDYKKLKFIINIMFYAIIAVIVFFFVKYAFVWALPFIIGVIIAILTRPLVRFCKNKLRIPEGISSTVFVIILYVAIGVLLLLLLNSLYNRLMVIKDDIPAFVASISGGIDTFFANVSEMVNDLPEGIAGPLGDFVDSAHGSIFNFVQQSVSQIDFTKILGVASGIATSLPNVFLFIVALVLSSIFISRDMPSIKAFIYMQLPERGRMALFEAREFLTLTIFRYVRAYALLMTMTFCELSVGFIIIGIAHPFLIAILISIVDILPVFGCGTILIPWSIISLINQNYSLAISIFLLYIVITVIRQVVEPKVVGSHIGLSPLITLFCIYVGFRVMGVIGMFIFPVLFILLRKLQESGYLNIWTPVKRIQK